MGQNLYNVGQTLLPCCKNAFLCGNYQNPTGKHSSLTGISYDIRSNIRAVSNETPESYSQNAVKNKRRREGACGGEVVLGENLGVFFGKIFSFFQFFF